MKYKYRILKKDEMYIGQVKRFLFWKTLHEDRGFGHYISEFAYLMDAKNVIQRYLCKKSEERRKKKNIVVDKGIVEI